MRNEKTAIVAFALVAIMKGLSPTGAVFEVPAPQALGALLVVGALTKAGIPGLAVAAMFVTYLLYLAARQITIFRRARR
jgi:hypothetical protein